jgi:heme/copper-type cytochrome/quinol oxidase subunit 4
MCFSPTVSLAASAVLTAAGIASLRKADTRKEMLFASIPLLFAVQQCVEGLLWLSLLNGVEDLSRHLVTNAYIVFVGIVWPLLIPLSIWVLEPEPVKKRMMLAVAALGAGIGVYSLNLLYNYGVQAILVDNCCIMYDNSLKQGEAEKLIYLVATCGAYFLCSYRSVRLIGMANLAGFVIAYYFYEINFASIWCFFAALISTLIYVYLERIHRSRLALQPAAAYRPHGNRE